MLAHQYLYYVGPEPIWSDFYYDKFCRKHGLDGNGGSDRAADYPPEIVALAMAMIAKPEDFPVP